MHGRRFMFFSSGVKSYDNYFIYLDDLSLPTLISLNKTGGIAYYVITIKLKESNSRRIVLVSFILVEIICG